MSRIITITVLVLAAGLLALFVRKPIERKMVQPKPTRVEQVPETKRAPSSDIEVIAENLKIPWEIAFLPNDELLVTERPGRLVKIGKDRQVIKIEGVHHIGEGGLLGMALHPNFSDNRLLYLYLTTKSGEGTINRVERYKFVDTALHDRTVILDNIPGAALHDGGRIAFGPDGLLYITTGDAGNEKNAQDKGSLAGKILRIADDGSIPKDNPFGNAVYSYGHRNSQGLAWDDKGQLWATEHGPSGIQSGLDELNRIEKGKNYGWPVIKGDEKREGMVSPVIQSGTEETWAPAGAAFLNSKIYFAGLRGQALFEADITKQPVTLKQHFRDKFGRLRAMVVGPDGFLYITTSNTDGRGTPNPGDDKLIKVNPSI